MARSKQNSIWVHLVKVFFAGALIASVGCARKNSADHRESVKLKAYRLIDEQRTDEAIALLESELKGSPGNYEYTTILASAYAHKAGVKIQNLMPVIARASSIKGFKPPDSTPHNRTQSELVNEAAMKMVFVLSQSANALGVYSTIPMVPDRMIVYLEYAVSLLGKLGERLQPEDALYKAVLGVVLFKHSLASDFIGQLSGPPTKSQDTCRVDFVAFKEASEKAAKILIDVLHDIGTADPRQADEMRRLASQTS